MSATLTVDEARRRFLTLVALRWFPVGLTIPVLVLLLGERGLSLSQVGLVVATQGVVVLLLELPTGGLADTLGRRPTLVVAGAFDIASHLVIAVASAVPVLVGAVALQGVYRALDSGPLEAWYVDASRAADPDGEVETGLQRAGTIIGVAIAAGALSSAGIVALDLSVFGTALAAPILLAAAARLVATVALVRLMTEIRPAQGRKALVQSVRAIPTTIAEAVAQVRSSHLLVALLAIEGLWGFGMTGFEVFFPPRVSELAENAERAAVILGPAVTVGWLASSLGTAALPWLRRRLSARTVGIILRVAQGATTAAMGAAIGLWGVVAAYLGTYAVHGAANVIHQTMLHDEITEHRTTVLSANSMTGMASGALGNIVIGMVAAGVHVSAALWVSGAALAVAAPLYLVGRHRIPSHAAEEPVPAGVD